jgi:hypothetical protein
MHLVGFIIRIYHDARSAECQSDHILSLAPCLRISRATPTLPHVFYSVLLNHRDNFICYICEECVRLIRVLTVPYSETDYRNYLSVRTYVAVPVTL